MWIFEYIQKHLLFDDAKDKTVYNKNMKTVIVCKCVGANEDMRSDTPLPLYAPAHILDDPLPSLQLRTCLMDGLFLKQKTKNIRISYSLKYKHSKKYIYSLRKSKIKKPIVQCQLCFARGLILQRKTPA